MKKTLSIFFSLIIIISIFAGFETTAYAATRTGTTGSLSWSLDTSSGLLTLSGNGASKDYSNTLTDKSPFQGWSTRDAKSYKDMIKNIVINEGVTVIGKNLFNGLTKLETVVFNGNTVTTISEGAFEGCTASTYWLDIPSSVTSIGSNAFNKTNFNYVKIFSPNITIADNAFRDKNGNGTYARFFGLHDSGVRSFIQQGQSNGFDWHYYCLIEDGHNINGAAHDYQIITYAPTCTGQGYDWYGCIYCDMDASKNNFTPTAGHKYRYLNTSGYNFIYSCTVCGRNDLVLDSIMVEGIFENALSHANDNSPYLQSNYDGKADLYIDGYINAKDFIMIENVVKNISTINKATVINENTTYQTMEGFGASACWWSQDVGSWENIDEIMELLYSKENGIGLNIYRYNLGGGSENDTGIGDWRRRAEDFLAPNSNISDSSTYDWNADINARKALASAQKANNDLKVTLFSNSAPISLTNNGKAYCSPVDTDSKGNITKRYPNLNESNYQNFANYVINCAEHFIDEGYNVTNISPINEPEWEWAADSNGNCSQEGSNWEYAAARTFYNDYMIPALKNSSLNGKVELSVWESGQLNHSTYWNNFLNNMFSSENSYANNNANIRDYVHSLDTHSYWASKNDRQTVAKQLESNHFSSVEKIRCTEYCQMTNDGNSGVYDLIQQEGGNTNGMTIEYGIALADIIYQDLTILNAVEWDWWTACSGGIYPDGLIYINYNDHNAIETSKRLWCLGNYSKFIQEGAKRIAVSTGSSMAPTIEQTAYKNPDGTVVIVYVNKGEVTQYTTFNKSQYSDFETYVTDELHNLQKYQAGKVGSKAVSIPAMSVTTVVLSK
ncbi:MAG: leucine-rich repeat protein [Eubacterium sp.]|nr:leucine-rich repeat protein [Eubacterium sp.]